jgi:hypothetical protein
MPTGLRVRQLPMLMVRFLFMATVVTQGAAHAGVGDVTARLFSPADARAVRSDFSPGAV